MTKKIQSLTIALIWLCSISAQTNNDPIYLNYSLLPMQKMKSIDGQAALQIAEANLVLPQIKIGKKTGVYTNLNYRFSRYHYPEKMADIFPERLNDIRLSFIIRHRLSEKWELVASPRANIRSDLSQEFTRYNIFPSLNILALRSSPLNPDLVWGLGVTYNNDLNKDVILPLTYVKYRNKNLRVYSILPSFAHIILTPSEKFEYGLSYNLDAAIFNTRKWYRNEEPNYLKTLNVSIAPAIGYNFAGKFWLNAKAGYAMFRNYQFLDAKFKDIAITEKNKLKGGAVATVGISMRIE
ncbi:MAG: hypothetical protein KIT80_13725 [Chitinophagaceae bacterium]|nr:hypothetical protein [Chitinophagaceae bacterium]MCW5927969.1 hypothetical protein [Chitinophagaceae bacterium]